MSSGGVFTPGVPKVRPGVYLNFKASPDRVTISENEGVAVIPFIGPTYGPLKTMITINSDNIGSISEVLGVEYNDSSKNISLLREALKGCSNVMIYLAGTGGTKATVTSGSIVATAKYAGTGGNMLKFALVANALGGFDVTVYLNGVIKSVYKKITTVAELTAISDPYIVFTTTGDEPALAAVAGATLTGGVNPTSANADFADFLSALDYATFNSVLCPIAPTTENASTIQSFISKVRYLNDGLGKYVSGVVVNTESDYECIINVCNTPMIDNADITIEEAAAFVAGLYAGSDELTSNTDVVYPGATGFNATNLLDGTAVENALKEGKFVFTLNDDNEVVVESDINSLTTITSDKKESFKRNKTIRVLQALARTIKSTFRPGTFDDRDDDEDSGYKRMEGLGATILSDFQERGAIKNVAEGDFSIDRTLSYGDALYVNVAVQPVNSIEKFYFTVAVN